MSDVPAITDKPGIADRLTPLQAAFVGHFTGTPGCIGNGAEAARRAGYSPKAAKETASKVANLPHVRAAIDRANREAISGRIATKAVALLERAIDDEDTPMKIRVQAAMAILDRGGFGAPTALEKMAAAAGRAGEGKLFSELSADELEARLSEVLAAHHRGPDHAKLIEGHAAEIEGDAAQG